MKKMICLVLLLAMLLGILAACGDQEQTSGTTKSGDTQSTDAANELPWVAIEEGYFDLLCDNVNCDRYLRAAGANFLIMWFIADRDLTDETITISSEYGSVEYTFLQYNSAPFVTETVYCTYKGISWPDLAAGSEATLDALETILSEYRRMQVNELPRLYAYQMMFSYFPLLGLPDDLDAAFAQLDSEGIDTFNIQTLTVTLGDVTKTYDVGLMQFRNEKAPSSGYIGAMTMMGGVEGYNTEPSADGVAKLPEFQINAEQDIVLESIYAIGDTGVQVRSVDLTITDADGATYTSKWDGVTPLELDAGSTVVGSLTVEAPNMANAISGNVVCQFVVQYQFEGTSYYVGYPCSWLIFTGAFDNYAVRVDGVDMLSYYLDYVNVVE